MKNVFNRTLAYICASSFIVGLLLAGGFVFALPYLWYGHSSSEGLYKYWQQNPFDGGTKMFLIFTPVGLAVVNGTLYIVWKFILKPVLEWIQFWCLTVIPLWLCCQGRNR